MNCSHSGRRNHRDNRTALRCHEHGHRICRLRRAQCHADDASLAGDDDVRARERGGEVELHARQRQRRRRGVRRGHGQCRGSRRLRGRSDRRREQCSRNASTGDPGAAPPPGYDDVGHAKSFGARSGLLPRKAADQDHMEVVHPKIGQNVQESLRNIHVILRCRSRGRTATSQHRFAPRAVSTSGPSSVMAMVCSM